MRLGPTRDDLGQAISHTGRQRLALFLVLAAWLHLFAFLGWERLGFRYLAGLDNPITEPRFLELTLELNPASPAEPLAPPKSSSFDSTPPAPPSNLERIGDPAWRPAVDPSLDSTATPADSTQTAFAPTDSTPALESGASLWPEAPVATPSTPPSSQDNTVSVEETAPRLKSYNVSVRGAVARRWLLPPEARSNFQPGRFTAVMTLDREGRIVVIAVEESSGSPSLDYAAMEALRGAAPFEPFPEELADHDQISFRLHFDYRAVYRPASPLK